MCEQETQMTQELALDLREEGERGAQMMLEPALDLREEGEAPSRLACLSERGIGFFLFVSVPVEWSEERDTILYIILCLIKYKIIYKDRPVRSVYFT